ncbi:MAG: hypothetical protein KAW12_09455 [Candidatus Aminicenantes bacterium]|nr:hypothetical protein [Candidatus Aminicenantes bacterium]
MKKGILLIIFLSVFVFSGSSQEKEKEKQPESLIPPQVGEEVLKPVPTPTPTPIPTPAPTPPPLRLGRIYFPRDFVHAQKDYKKGVYRLNLISKEEVPYFQILSKKGELLFEEMGLVKPYKGRNKRFRYRLSKAMMRGYEYFRIRVTRPDKYIMAFFFIKQPEKPAPPDTGEPKKSE